MDRVWYGTKKPQPLRLAAIRNQIVEEVVWPRAAREGTLLWLQLRREAGATRAWKSRLRRGSGKPGSNACRISIASNSLYFDLFPMRRYRMPGSPFMNRISGMRKQNLLYERKLVIVSPVSSTLPKDGLTRSLSGFFFTLPRAWDQFSGKPAISASSSARTVWLPHERLKEKTRDHIDAGFPVFSLPTFQVWILWANNEGNRLACLCALQHLLFRQKNTRRRGGGGLRIQILGGKEETVPCY